MIDEAVEDQNNEQDFTMTHIDIRDKSDENIVYYLQKFLLEINLTYQHNFVKFFDNMNDFQMSTQDTMSILSKYNCI